MLGEFMGAINLSGEQYLNFLLRADRERRMEDLKQLSLEANPPPRTEVFAFGSFIRRKHYHDVDLMVVYEEPADSCKLKEFESELDRLLRKRLGEPDISVASAREFTTLRLKYDNLSRVYP